jgi:hypothetical protein
MALKTIEIESISDFIRETRKLRKKHWVFRGHASENWRIESTLSRFLKTHGQNIKASWQPARERDAIRKFQRAAHDFLNHLPNDKDILEWMAVMRHYGAPTRLIDFTYSPITALFFAASNPFRSFDENLVVHAINVEEALKQTCAVLEKKSQNRISPEDFQLDKTPQSIGDFIGFFEGRWNTPRQLAQQGLFMVTSRIETDVHKFLESCSSSNTGTPEPWLCFKFKDTGIEFHKQVTNHLLEVNQTHASLYPGIEGLAQSLFMKFYEPLPPAERYWTQ